MTTPESRTVEETDVFAAIERAERAVDDLCSGKLRWEMRVPAEPDHDPDLIISKALILAKDALEDAAKEHGLVIGEGELDRAWKEAEEVLDSRGERFAMLRRYGDTYDAWWIKKEDGKLDGVEGQPTPTAALQALTVKLRESRR